MSPFAAEKASPPASLDGLDVMQTGLRETSSAQDVRSAVGLPQRPSNSDAVRKAALSLNAQLAQIDKQVLQHVIPPRSQSQRPLPDVNQQVGLLSLEWQECHAKEGSWLHCTCLYDLTGARGGALPKEVACELLVVPISCNAHLASLTNNGLSLCARCLPPSAISSPTGEVAGQALVTRLSMRL